ncbi:serine carboxypeptidase-like protein 16 [Tanacetum coccineum]
MSTSSLQAEKTVYTSLTNSQRSAGGGPRYIWGPPRPLGGRPRLTLHFCPFMGKVYPGMAGETKVRTGGGGVDEQQWWPGRSDPSTGDLCRGQNEEVQLFYYFVESQRNPEEDPLLFYLPGGPGGSALVTLLCQIGPLSFNVDNDIENLTLTLNPYSWTKLANIIFMDIPVGVGYSYGKIKEAYVSSDKIMVTQATDFVKKFLIKHPKFLKNPLYITGMSYMGIVTPAITLELYEGNERGDQPTLNIQGYILCSPLTDKFMDFNSRFLFAYRVGLISEDIYKLGIESCDGDYINTDTTNSSCAYIIQQNKEEYFYKFVNVWANTEAAQKALNVRQGMIGKWEPIDMTIHYIQGKNDTACYSYDIFSSFAYHKKLVRKKCRALVFSGDHDLTFPYVGVEQWIASLDTEVEIPWKPFYVDAQVGGYEESEVARMAGGTILRKDTKTKQIVHNTRTRMENVKDKVKSKPQGSTPVPGPEVTSASSGVCVELGWATGKKNIINFENDREMDRRDLYHLRRDTISGAVYRERERTLVTYIYGSRWYRKDHITTHHLWGGHLKDLEGERGVRGVENGEINLEGGRRRRKSFMGKKWCGAAENRQSEKWTEK